MDVIGKPNPQVNTSNSIIAENRFQQLKITSIDSLISLADLMEYDVNQRHLSILKPSASLLIQV